MPETSDSTQDPAPSASDAKQPAASEGKQPAAEAAAKGAPADVAAPAAVPPSFLFMAWIASGILLLDALTKWWAETTLSLRPAAEPAIVLIEDVLNFHLAYNKGGAFGMLSDEHDSWRGPFFLLISFGAVAFIVSLYRRVAPQQWALKWGLPLVLGGALGNLADRIAKGRVVDFIDYKAGWVQVMNETIQKINEGWHVTNHWPTFNVADMAICTGVGLMALDMFLSSRSTAAEPNGNSAPSGGAAAS